MRPILLTCPAKSEPLFSSAGVFDQSQLTPKNVTEMSLCATTRTHDSAAVRDAGTRCAAVRRSARPDAGASVHAAGPAGHPGAVCPAQGGGAGFLDRSRRYAKVTAITSFPGPRAMPSFHSSAGVSSPCAGVSSQRLRNCLSGVDVMAWPAGVFLCLSAWCVLCARAGLSFGGSV